MGLTPLGAIEPLVDGAVAGDELTEDLRIFDGLVSLLSLHDDRHKKLHWRRAQQTSPWRNASAPLSRTGAGWGERRLRLRSPTR